MNTLERYVRYLASFLLVFSISMILLNVFYRYILLGIIIDNFENIEVVMSIVNYLDVLIGDIIVTSDEVPGYLLIWISFLGAFMVARNPGHINFDLFINKNENFKTIITIFNYTAIIIFFAIFLVLSTKMIMIDGATEIETADVPQGYFMMILPIASVLLILAYVEQIIKLIKKGK
jgi:TRAP-type C4-dicarboxylate transport system permease small subunit